MTYRRIHRPADRAATLIAVGALHAAAFYAVITGLSVAFNPVAEPLPFSATNSPLPPPPPTETHARPRRTEREITTVVTPLPTALPTPSPSAVATTPVIIDPVPTTGTGGTGPNVLPDPRPTPRLVAPRAARPLGRPGDWITEADYPTDSIRRGHAGVVGFALAVSPAGRATACEITRSSGFAELDALTCALMLRRGRFQPATDDQGGATAGRYASAVRWQIPE